jgi:hypothetical protein
MAFVRFQRRGKPRLYREFDAGGKAKAGIVTTIIVTAIIDADRNQLLEVEVRRCLHKLRSDRR